MKVLLVSKGDARRRRTWSGVPRHVLDSLVAEGHEVKLLNVFDDFLFHWVGAVWNRTHDFRRREFETTRLGGWLMARAVRRAARGCDRVVALTFALDASTVQVPVELLHDWTPGYFWRRFDKAEARLIERMRGAAKVKCLYPASAEYLRGRGLDVEFVGLPVDVPDDVKARVKGKVGKDGPRYVVFASPWHMDNLEEALRYLDGKKGWRLDVVGEVKDLTQRDGETEVVLHGYLDKDDEREAREYWDVLAGADCILALGRTWPGGSSVAEARACGCKVAAGDWPDLADSTVGTVWRGARLEPD